MTRKLSIALLLTLFFPATLLWGQVNSAASMNRIPIEGYGELAKAISAPDLDIQSKRYAVARLGELSKDLPSHKEILPSKLYNPILGVLTPQRGVKDHHVLREEACSVLGNFAKVQGGSSLIGPLGRVVKNTDENSDVRVAAARSLSRFVDYKAKATEILVEALNVEVKRGPQKHNVRVVGALIASIGKLGDKRAFVPLMRVLRSRFPASTKRQAQSALELLDWKK